MQVFRPAKRSNPVLIAPAFKIQAIPASVRPARLRLKIKRAAKLKNA